MERKRMSASNIRAVGFDSRNRLLEIEDALGGQAHYAERSVIA